MRVVWAPAPIGARPAGPQVYSVELARAITAARPDDQFVVHYEGRLARSETERFIREAGQPQNLVTGALPIPHRVVVAAERAGVHVRGAVLGSFDVFHQMHLEVNPRLESRRLVLTVHDTVSFVFADESRPIRSVETLLHRAEVIVTVSQYSKNALVELFPRLDRVVAVPNGSRMAIPGHLAKIEPVGRPYVLYVGGQTARKNLVRTIDAFSLFASQHRFEHELVLVGPLDPVRQEVSEAIQRAPAGSVRVAGYVSDERLVELYHGASALVMASLSEGFGFPVLDAMTLGTPVVTTRRSAMEEVTDDVAVLVDPMSVDDIAQGIATVVGEDETRQMERRQRGLVRARDFSWRRSAEGYLAVYESVSR